MVAEVFGGCLLGETHHSSLMLNKDHKCTCGEQLQDCLFWSPVLKELGKISDTKYASRLGKWPILAFSALKLNTRECSLFFGGILPQLKNEVRAAEEIVRIYAAIKKTHNPALIVDSSKYTPLFLLLNDMLGNKLKVVWLVRDGRAVTSSIMRRSGQDVVTAARIWKRFNINSERAHQCSLSSGQLFFIRYEDLVLNFNEEMTRLGAFLGVQHGRFSDQLTARLENYHFLGGSPTLRAKDEIKLRFDDRWRKELSAADLKEFEKVAGKYNRKLGYLD